jgi:hypothetical protein
MIALASSIILAPCLAVTTQRARGMGQIPVRQTYISAAWASHMAYRVHCIAHSLKILLGVNLQQQTRVDRHKIGLNLTTTHCDTLVKRRHLAFCSACQAVQTVCLEAQHISFGSATLAT